MERLMPNPALKDLESLVGKWSVEMAFPADPPGTVRGQVSFTGLESCSCTGEWPRPSSAVVVIGRDDAAETYSMLYDDARGVSRIYEMSFGRRRLEAVAVSPDFSQRFTGTFGDDDTIAARWKKSSDGSEWEHDFDLTYARDTGLPRSAS